MKIYVILQYTRDFGNGRHFMDIVYCGPNAEKAVIAYNEFCSNTTETDVEVWIDGDFSSEECENFFSLI